MSQNRIELFRKYLELTYPTPDEEIQKLIDNCKLAEYGRIANLEEEMIDIAPEFEVTFKKHIKEILA